MLPQCTKTAKIIYAKERKIKVFKIFCVTNRKIRHLYMRVLKGKLLTIKKITEEGESDELNKAKNLQ